LRINSKEEAKRTKRNSRNANLIVWMYIIVTSTRGKNDEYWALYILKAKCTPYVVWNWQQSLTWLQSF
jgi:hypothetical protein